MPNNKIIAAVDLSHKDWDTHVVKEAILLAKTHKADIELVFVIPDQQNSYVQEYIPTEMRDQVNVDAAKDLKAYADTFDWQGISRSENVLRGVVYETLIKHADTVSARFIVIGANKPSVSDLFIGPNAARVARHAACSVLVVRPE